MFQALVPFIVAPHGRRETFAVEGERDEMMQALDYNLLSFTASPRPPLNRLLSQRITASAMAVPRLESADLFATDLGITRVIALLLGLDRLLALPRSSSIVWDQGSHRPQSAA